MLSAASLMRGLTELNVVSASFVLVTSTSMCLVTGRPHGEHAVWLSGCASPTTQGEGPAPSPGMQPVGLEPGPGVLPWALGDRGPRPA